MKALELRRYAAAMQESSRLNGCKVAVIASGGNIDRKVYAAVLNGEIFAALMIDNRNKFSETAFVFTRR